MEGDLTFGVWLKRRRRQLDLTQKGLAHRVGCSVGTIRKIESDDRHPSRQLAGLLAQHLDIPKNQHDDFIAFARAEPYLTDASFPIFTPVAEPIPSLPSVSQQPLSQSPSIKTVKHNLPADTSPFVGRNAELDTLDSLFKSGTRQVTIVGPGGMGKTRLALAWAINLVDRISSSTIETPFPHGIFFIDLAPLQDLDRVILTLSETLNFRIQAGFHQKRSVKQQLLDYLRDRCLLLILDNFEHLLSPPHLTEIETKSDSATLVAEILKTAPEICILVTSRERLHLHMEQVFPIDGLFFPDLETVASGVGVGNVDAYTAIQLFLQAAKRNQLNFSLETRDESLALVRICQMAGGMPLALELAASWVDALSVVDIAVELKRGIDLLETELRDVPLRQRSIRATFDTSWRKLDERGKSVFSQLSIFRGGFTRPAVMAVTGASPRQLSRLVSKSYVQYDKARDRYKVHELLRQFGAEKLKKGTNVEKDLHDRHSAYYLQTLADLTNDLKSANQPQAISAIEADIENVRLAWNHAVSNRNYQAIGISLEALRRFHWVIGWLHQGATEFEKAVAALRTGEKNPEKEFIFGRLLGSLGKFSGWIGKPERTREVGEESLRILRRHGALKEQMEPIIFLSSFQESNEESTRLAEEALKLARKFDDHWMMGMAQMMLAGNAKKLGKFDEAEQFFQDSLNNFKVTGDVSLTSWALYWLSILVGDRGRHNEALNLAQEAASKSGDLKFPIMGPRALGIALYAMGEYEEAEEQFHQSLEILKELGLREWARIEYFYIGKIALKKGDYILAEKLFNDVLKGNPEFDGRELVSMGHDALGRLHLAQGNNIKARKHFRNALSVATWPTTILAVTISIAELFSEGGNQNEVALLALFITNHSGSLAKTKERGVQLLAQLKPMFSETTWEDIHKSSRKTEMNTLASNLLRDLESDNEVE